MINNKQTCTCPCLQRGGSPMSLQKFGDKLVNNISMNAGVVLRPTKTQLKKLESALNQLIKGGFDLLNEEKVHLLIYGTMESIPSGYKDLVRVMDDILKTAPHHEGSTYQQVGGVSQQNQTHPQCGGHLYAKKDNKIYLTK